MISKLLLKQWLYVLVVAAFLLYGVVFHLVQGDYEFGLVPVMVVALFLFARFRNPKLIANLFKETKPEKMVEYNKKTTNKKTLHYNAILAFNMALPYCLWGDFESARLTMNKIDWSTIPEAIQSFKSTINALEIYFTEGDYRQGLMYAKQARNLGTLPSYFPGAKKSNILYDILVEIGQILTEGFTPELERNLLQTKAGYSGIILKLFASWALANGYEQLGQKQKVQEMLDYCRINAPYCKPFLTVVSPKSFANNQNII